MRMTVVILLIFVLAQTAVFGELTKEDLEEIRKVVKEEISASEQRTGIKLAEINTEIKVIKTDINGVKDRLGDTHRLVLVLIALIGGTMAIAVAMTYAARKLAGAMTEMQKVHASADETNELIKEDIAANNETNRFLSEYAERVEEQNAHLADLRAHIEEMKTNIENSTEEPSNGSISHAPAD